MGNKNSSSSMMMDKDKGTTEGEVQGATITQTESVSGGGGLIPSAEVLMSLQSMGENRDFTLMPHSLHQIAEAYFHQDEYQLAVQFLELEKLYHERLLFNLKALQENWESQWKERKADKDVFSSEEEDSLMHSLTQICRTHLSPQSTLLEQKTLACVFKDIQDKIDVLKNCQNQVDRLKSQLMEARGRAQFPHSMSYEDQEVEDDTTPEEDEVRVEWPTGVPQASEKDLAKLSSKDGNTSSDGLVSILKQRRASLDGLPPPNSTCLKQNAKQRKVRFSEDDDGIEQDEGSSDSCLILLFPCLMTVAMSLGGTALYCTLLDSHSNICIDFTQNLHYYFSYIRRISQGLGLGLLFRT